MSSFFSREGGFAPALGRRRARRLDLQTQVKEFSEASWASLSPNQRVLPTTMMLTCIGCWEVERGDAKNKLIRRAVGRSVLLEPFGI